MKIFISHSTGFDYKKELYEPIKSHFENSDIEFIYPEDAGINSFNVIKSCDAFIAEVSFPSTGSGIEIGWANSFGKPVHCLHKANCKPSGALKLVTSNIYAYKETEELISILNKIIKKNNME